MEKRLVIKNRPPAPTASEVRAWLRHDTTKYILFGLVEEFNTEQMRLATTNDEFRRLQGSIDVIDRLGVLADPSSY